jgi:tetratricopeptide (TPR) repeat protein
MSAVEANHVDTDGSSDQGRARSSRRRGRRRGIEIRAGSVKQARLEAGLSLGQVALGDISRTAIYFVETGKARPSIETLQLIATRTNKPMDFFVGDTGDSAALAEVERLVSIGDNAAAVEAAEALLKRSSDARTVATARLSAAPAHIRLGQPAEARALAAAARAHFESAGDVLMTAESIGWEAAGALMMQDPAALSLAREALARCRSLSPVPANTEAKLLAIVGHAHSFRHEYTEAIQAYEQATAVDTAFTDLRRLSYIYGNLSLAYQETGRYAEAARYLHRALALQETLHDTISIAVSENNLALLLHRQGDLAGAFSYAESSNRRYEELGIDAGRANVLMTLAELELARSNYYAAARWATMARDVARRAGEPVNVGEAHLWLGRVAAARRDYGAADAEFVVAFQIFESADAVEWQARGHTVYAEILEARGDLAAANRHLRLALAAVQAPARPVAETSRAAIA